MQRDTMDEDGIIVEYGTHVYAASRYSFEIFGPPSPSHQSEHPTARDGSYTL